MVIIIPAKPFSEAKSRLSSVLTTSERTLLSRYLLQRTIKLAGRTGQVVVVSRCHRVRQLAKQLGAWALIEGGHDLNQAIQQGRSWVVAQGGKTVLILPSDLPHLTITALSRLQQLDTNDKIVAIAPCQRRDGTNVLMLNPPMIIPLQFGTCSFFHHQQAALERGITPHIIQDPALTFDLDLPEDWQTVQPEFSQQLLVTIQQ